MHSGACRNAVLEDGIAEKNLKARKLIGSFWRYLNDSLYVETA